MGIPLFFPSTVFFFFLFRVSFPRANNSFGFIVCFRTGSARTARTPCLFSHSTVWASGCLPPLTSYIWHSPNLLAAFQQAVSQCPTQLTTSVLMRFYCWHTVGFFFPTVFCLSKSILQIFNMTKQRPGVKLSLWIIWFLLTYKQILVETESVAAFMFGCKGRRL